MSRSSRLRLVALLCVGATVSVFAVSAPSSGAAGVRAAASADPGGGLWSAILLRYAKDSSVYEPAAMLADKMHDRVFTSGGSSNDGYVAVTDLDGRLIADLHNLPGAGGMVLSADHGSLYVALRDLPGLAVIDTETLAVRIVHTASDSCPSTVALTAGLLWFTSQCSDVGKPAGELNTWDPATGEIHRGIGPHYGGAQVMANPERPDELLLKVFGGDIQRVAVTGGDQPTSMVTGHLDTENRTTSFIYSADKQHLLVTTDVQQPSGGPPYIGVVDLDNLSIVDRYPLHGDPVAVRDDGTLVLRDATTDGPDLELYDPGGRGVVRQFTLSGGIGDLDGDGRYRTGLLLAAWGDDQLNVVTLTDDDFGGGITYRLLSLSPTQVEPPRIRSDAPSYTPGDEATVRVATHDFATYRPVRVFATVSGHRSEIADGALNKRGVFNTSLPLTRTTTFDTELDGDPSLTDTVVVPVVARVGIQLTSGHVGRGGRYFYNAGQRPRADATFEPAREDACVRFHVQRRIRPGTPWRLVSLSSCRAVDTDGHVSWAANRSFGAGTRLRVRAEWAGDADNDAAVTRWAGIHYEH